MKTKPGAPAIPQTPGARDPTPRRAILVAAAVIVLAVAGVYLNSLPAPFLYDDEINITRNPYIRMTELSLDQIKRAMVQDGFQLRPLSNLSFALDHYLHALSPRSMRLENIALHLAASLLLFLILHHLIGTGARDQVRPTRRAAAALFGTLAWALHPAQVQAVVYIVQRQTVLAVAATLAAFYLYLITRTGGVKTKWLAAVLAVAAALVAAGAKEIGLLAPVFCLLFELLVVAGKDGAGRGRRALALIIAAAVLAALAIFAAARAGVIAGYAAEYGRLGYGPLERVLTEARVVARYLLVMVFPHPGLMAIDQEVEVSRSIVDPPATLLALLFFAALAAIAILGRRRQPLATFLIAAFLLALAPESSIIPIDLIADHRLYLYSLFVLPPLVAVLALHARRRPAVALLAAATILSGVLTVGRERVFGSLVGVWREAVTAAPGRARPWSNYCAALAGQGDYQSAIRACGRAAALGPAAAEPRVNQAICLMKLGRTGEAGAIFREAAQQRPESALAQYNYGGFLETQADLAGAMAYYRRALAADQFHFEARLNLSRLLRVAHDANAAVKEAELLVRLYPDSGAARLELAHALVETGDRSAAIKVVEEASARGLIGPELENDFNLILERTDPRRRGGP